MKKKLKQATRIKDRVLIEGGSFTHTEGGIASEHGKPVDPKIVAEAFGVSVEKAVEISRRLSL
tara:strand:+ start:400 stop:588 length:189 start_codon:yes stop_codon:yes gene_type:complete